jgi:HNH endonuclease/AP2 domain
MYNKGVRRSNAGQIHLIARGAIMTPSEDYRLIPLTHGQFAKVDAADFDWLMTWKWHALPDRNVGFRAARDTHRKIDGKRTNKRFLMHREIIACPEGMFVDHINGDPLDNRRVNLRICTFKQNRYNSRKRKEGKNSPFKGVYRNRKFWRAVIMKDRKYLHIGNFGSQEEAARAYDSKARELFGEFAHLNFPEKMLD